MTIRFTTLMYLLGMFLLLLGERMIGGDDSLRWGLDGIGLLCLLSVLVKLGRSMTHPETEVGQQKSYRVAFVAALVGISSQLRARLNPIPYAQAPDPTVRSPQYGGRHPINHYRKSTIYFSTFHTVAARPALHP